MSQGTDVVWLKVSMSEPITALKLLSLKVYKTMSFIKGVHQLDHSIFLGLIFQHEVAATIPVFERGCV